MSISLDIEAEIEAARLAANARRRRYRKRERAIRQRADEHGVELLRPDQVLELLGITYSQRQTLYQHGHLRRVTFEDDGQLCRRGELLPTCQCDFEADPSTWGDCRHFVDTSPSFGHEDRYYRSDVERIGYLGCAANLAPGQRARPLPAHLLHPLPTAP